MKSKRVFLIVLCIFVVAAVLSAALPLFRGSYIPTHDGEYHIIRITEFAKMLSQGYLFPRWAPTLNSGYGIPIFQYHYPLPNYIGSFVSMFTHDAVRAFFLSLGLGYLVAVAASFGWLASIFGIVPALVGAIVSAYVPYWFVDLYVRGSIGEVWAMAFLFLTLFAIEKKQCVFTSISFALLIVSHNILAMICTPFLLVYMCMRNRRTILSLIMGIGLSAYFWFPAIIEKSYVVGLNTVNFREHFASLYELLIPSWGTEFSGTGMTGNKISFQVGMIPILLAILTVVLLWKEKRNDIRRLGWYFIAVSGAAVIFMLSFTKIIWETIQPLQFVQYPWRLLSFVIPLTAFSGAFVMSRMKKPIAGIIVSVLSVLFAYSYTRPVLYEPRNENYYLSRSNFMDGTSSMGNSFSTIWTGWKDTRPEGDLVIQNGKMTKKGTWQYLKKECDVIMDDQGWVTLNTLYFPGWKASIDGKEVPILFEFDGIIRIPVSTGVHAVRIQMTDTWPRTTGNIISVVSLVGIIVWGILTISRKPIKPKVKSDKENVTGLDGLLT